MNYAVILSGGVGTRMREDGFPKQYLEVQGKPVLLYTLERFQQCENVDRVIVVADPSWQDRIRQWAQDSGITKLVAYANPGETRQHSLLNGLLACEQFGIIKEDTVLVHDGVRPLVTPKLISDCVAALQGHDAVLPVLPMKDTTYYSEDGVEVFSLTDRSKLFCGQTPETFWLQQYLELNRSTPDAELALIRGSCEIAYKNGWNIRMIPGDEMNFKLTTPDDMLRLNFYVSHGRE